MRDSSLFCGTLELHDELSAFARFGADRDLAIVGLNNLVDDGKTKSSAAAESTLEWFEDLIHLLRIDSGTAVMEADPPVIAGRAYSDIERSRARHGTHGVLAEVPEDLL